MVPIHLYRVQHLESINLVFSNTLKKGNKIKKNLQKEKKILRKTRKPWWSLSSKSEQQLLLERKYKLQSRRDREEFSKQPAFYFLTMS